MSERRGTLRGSDKRPAPALTAQRNRPASSAAARAKKDGSAEKGRAVTPSPDLPRHLSYQTLARQSQLLANTPARGNESADSNLLTSPFSKYSHVSPKIDSGLPHRRSRVNLLPEFSGLLSPADDPLFTSFMSMPASTVEMLTREELLRRRVEVNRSSYDALILRIIQHYYETDPSAHESEIALLKSLLGLMGEADVPALLLLPGLPEDVRNALQQSQCSAPTLLESESSLRRTISQLTVKRFDCLRGITHPSPFLLRVSAAYLTLFSKVDSAIEVTPGFHLVVSRTWETWQAYIKQPGHAVQTARSVVESVKKGSVGPVEIKETRAILEELKPRGSDASMVEETAHLLYRFLLDVDRFYSEWTSLNPSLHPKRPTVDLSKSSDRLSRAKSTPQSQCKATPQRSEAAEFSLVIDSPTRHAVENKDVRIPSFGPGQFNMTETSIPSLDFEAVIVEPLDAAVAESCAEKGAEQATMRVKEDQGAVDQKLTSSSEMTLDWELELRLRRLIQEKIERQGGDLASLPAEKLTGEAWAHSASLLSDLRSEVTSGEWAEKQVKSVGLDRFNSILEKFEQRLRQPQQLKREIGKAVLRVKSEAERQEREKHLEKLRAERSNQ